MTIKNQSTLHEQSNQNSINNDLKKGDCESKFSFDQTDIETVLEKYSEMVYKLAFARTKNNYDADDTMQEVFLRYIQYKPNLSSEEHRKAWLIRTTINCSNSLFSSNWYRKIIPLTDNLHMEMESQSEVYYAVMDLSLKYRTVIHLFYYQEYKISEIADILQIKQSTVKSQLHRARNMLRKTLGEQINFE